MNKTPPINELKALAGRGGGMILDCQEIPASELKIIAGRASESQAQIILKNPHRLPVDEMKIIADRGKGCVIFDFFHV